MIRRKEIFGKLEGLFTGRQVSKAANGIRVSTSGPLSLQLTDRRLIQDEQKVSRITNIRKRRIVKIAFLVRRGGSQKSRMG
jgi:hypothetical protein